MIRDDNNDLHALRWRGLNKKYRAYVVKPIVKNDHMEITKNVTVFK